MAISNGFFFTKAAALFQHQKTAQLPSPARKFSRLHIVQHVKSLHGWLTYTPWWLMANMWLIYFNVLLVMVNDDGYYMRNDC